MNDEHTQNLLGTSSDSLTGQRTGSLADDLVAAIVPSRRPSSAAASPNALPLVTLAALPTDGSIRYGLATMDHRGRIADSSVIDALHWRPDDPLDIRVVSGAIVVRPDPGGLYALTSRGHIYIPVAVRRRCELATGERVFLVAAPKWGVLILHTMATLDAMVLAYHQRLPTEGPES